MRTSILPIKALLLGIGILFTGNGLLGSLVPLKAEIASFNPTVIGFLGTSYFFGFLVGCVVAPGLVRRIGHIRAFAAFASLATMAAILHGLILDPALWIVLRLVVGFAAAALYMIIESWLNGRSEARNRGTIMGIYAFVNLGALALGQQLLLFAKLEDGFLFLVVALATSAAILPITLTHNEAPPMPPAAKLPIRRLLDLSPVGVVGCFLNGLSNGPFWALGPSYALQIDLPLTQIAHFMAIPIVAGALSAWPIGLLSDRLDRRLVVTAAWIVVAVVCAALIVIQPQGPALFIFMAIFGAAIMPINSLYVAHVNDSIENGDRIAISSGLILLFGIGATIGPVLAGAIIGALGPGGLFLHIGTIAFLGSAFTLYRITRSDRPSSDQREGFQVVPRTTQTVAELDTRVVGPSTPPEEHPAPDPKP